MLQSLDHIRLDRILQKRCHGTCRLQIICCHRFSVKGIGNDNLSKTSFEVCKVVSKTENRHNLGCHSDNEMIFPYHTVHLVSKAHNDISENTVIHILAAFPYDLSWINSQLVSLLNMIVKQSRQQVVCRCDCVKITGKMKIQIFHWNNLGISAASCSSDSETWTQGWFTKGNQCFLSDFCHGFSESYRHGGLTFSGRCRIDRRYKDKFSIWTVFHLIPQFC